MTTEAPSIAVVIATYNRGPAISRTLDSVLAQTVRASEVIVVDDGSSDGTGDWTAGRYPGVRVVRRGNGGTSAARNTGASAASTDILVFLDHDDELLPHGLEVLSQGLGVFRDARAAFADHQYLNTVTGIRYPDHHKALAPFARLQRIPIIRADSGWRLYGRPMFRALLQGNLLQQPWAVRRAFFLSLGGFSEDTRYCEDWDMYMRVTGVAPIALTDAVISVHWVEGQNLHLSKGQDEMAAKVMQRVLRGPARRDLGATMVLRRRLAMCYKGFGDREESAPAARRWYVRSAVLWPFDHVVVARALGVLPPPSAPTGRS